jgi:DNA-binding PadR family transcriptional regulator
MSGYDIRKLVTEGTLAHFCEASFGAIYPALDKLEADGLVTSREERAAGKPPRRVFAITAAGRAAYVAALHEMPKEDEFRSPFLLVAASAALVRPEHLRRVIDARLAWCRREIARMEAEKARDAGCADQGWEWTLDYGLEMYRTSVRWLEANRERLEAGAGSRLAESGRDGVAGVATGVEATA